MKKPQINKIKPDIKNLSIYLRSVKKWGKSTLFRDLILEKYHDPSCGLLVKCGAEDGDTMLDDVNSVSVESYRDMKDLESYLIEKVLVERDEKGRVISKTPIEHNIQIVAFDTADELVKLADQETVRISQKDEPAKKIRSIKGAMGGYGAGAKYSAETLITPFIQRIKKAGFGVWVIAHTSFKTIREKGSVDEEGYQQLTSNLDKQYESAFGDVLDVVLTGVIDRTYNTVEKEVMGKKKNQNYIKSEERRLYFRGTTLIDAGGRFAPDAIEEYMVFDPDKNNAVEFLRIVEEGMEKSKRKYRTYTTETESKPLPDPVEEEEVPKDPIVIEDEIDIEDEEFDDEVVEEEEFEEDSDEGEEDITVLQSKVQALFKGCKDKEKKSKVRAKIKEYGSITKTPASVLQELLKELSV